MFKVILVELALALLALLALQALLALLALLALAPLTLPAPVAFIVIPASPVWVGLLVISGKKILSCVQPLQRLGVSPGFPGSPRKS